MLVMLTPDDAPDPAPMEHRYVVLTVQPRVPAGSLSFVEIPAGMVDDAGSFKGVAAKEIEEELGMTIHEDELVCLSDLAAEKNSDQTSDTGDEQMANAMFPSAGGCDEHVTLYSCERRLPRDQIEAWNGRLTGLRSHGEKITLKVVPMQHLWKVGARDAKALSALALWEGLWREDTARRAANK
jgi:ADP-sugar diphosphatase